MYVRIATMEVRPGQLDELARRWETYFRSVSWEGDAGPRFGYLTTNRATRTVRSVSLWETLPDEAAIAPLMRAFGEQVDDQLAGPWTVEMLEVLAEV